MSPIVPRIRPAVSERRWYRFGYIGPELGAIEEVNPSEPMRLVGLQVRPTTDDERGPGGLHEDCDTVAFLEWQHLDEEPDGRSTDSALSTETLRTD
jgi:hypothetical protein